MNFSHFWLVEWKPGGSQKHRVLFEEMIHNISTVTIEQKKFKFIHILSII